MSDDTVELKLDKSRSYGEVHPPENGACYEQDGFLFDNFGIALVSRMTDEQKERIRIRNARAAAEKKANEARSKALAEAGVEDEEAVVRKKTRGPNKAPSPAAPKMDEEEGPDLVRWAKGEINIPFDKVQTAIRAKHGKNVTSLANAIEFVGEENEIPAEKLRAS